ncbi:glycosyltransferase family protein [Funiculus sociatus]
MPPAQDRWFYNSQRFTLNFTRADMIRAGYSPSVRLFEAACGTPIISDRFFRLDTIFEFGTEILIADRSDDILRYLQEIPENEIIAIDDRARTRVLSQHTAAYRAAQLEGYILQMVTFLT